MHVGRHADLKGSNMLRNLLKSRQFSYDYIKSGHLFPVELRTHQIPILEAGSLNVTHARTHTQTEMWSRSVTLLILRLDARWGG